MCTTNLCIAFYVLTFCILGWFGALALILIKSTKDQGNVYVVDPIACWINSELVNPLNCFKGEVIKPLLNDLSTAAREWNAIVGSKPKMNF
ncbi:hypothetical protein [Prochlorococcus sp. MIT 1223]|uniref:hypothetical protein n=1 Tax=Prochlorococcus sp. MIT 1223 TaxID=3096217 RepID=UPI002A759B6F|nr:hypothetical protein [Prochlorococcus sp. MIT 1223]